MLFLVARPRSEPQSAAALLLAATRRALMLVIGQVRQYWRVNTTPLVVLPLHGTLQFGSFLPASRCIS